MTYTYGVHILFGVEIIAGFDSSGTLLINAGEKTFQDLWSIALLQSDAAVVNDAFARLSKTGLASRYTYELTSDFDGPVEVVTRDLCIPRDRDGGGDLLECSFESFLNSFPNLGQFIFVGSLFTRVLEHSNGIGFQWKQRFAEKTSQEG